MWCFVYFFVFDIFPFAFFELVKTGGGCGWFKGSFLGKKFGELLCLSLLLHPLSLEQSMLCLPCCLGGPYCTGVSALVCTVSCWLSTMLREWVTETEVPIPTPSQEHDRLLCGLGLPGLWSPVSSPLGVFEESGKLNSEDAYWPVQF